MLMIVTSQEMKAIEQASGFSANELMQTAGKAAAKAIAADTAGKHILIIAGKGNNGGDGYVIASLLDNARVFAVAEPATPEAKQAYAQVPAERIVPAAKFSQALKECDVIVDAVFGFSYKGTLSPDLKALFRRINTSGKFIYSIDINSGCEADTGHCDSDCIKSDVTLALDCLKPFHAMRKNHRAFKEVRVLPLGLPHQIKPKCHEMDEDLFFRSFPCKEENAYKGTYGKTLLIGGSWGMAGALCLNITGAKTVGASYITAALPEEIYTIAASHFMTPVFRPLNQHNWSQVLEPAIREASALCWGSGAVGFPCRQSVLDLVLQTARCPIVLDAEALRLLEHNTWVLRFAKAPVILTPHIGEFCAISGKTKEYVEDHALESALDFAKRNRCIVVLKKPNTVVASPSGDFYINQTGNQALAQAGSGDLLTGILTGLLSMTCDVFTAVCMGVWLHGYLADCGTEYSSRQNFSLESYPQIMDGIFRKHGL